MGIASVPVEERGWGGRMMAARVGDIETGRCRGAGQCRAKNILDLSPGSTLLLALRTSPPSMVIGMGWRL